MLFLGAYMMIFVIIITNILIALFGETLQQQRDGINDMHDQLTLVIESSYDLPFSTLSLAFICRKLDVFSIIEAKLKLSCPAVPYYAGPCLDTDCSHQTSHKI